MTLYEINQAILGLVDPETGEIVDFDSFQELQMDKQEKRENTALYIKNLNAEVAAIKAEEDALRKRREVLEKRAKSLADYLQKDLSGETFSTPRCQISYRKSTAVEVVDADVAATWLNDNGYYDMVTRAAPQIDKAGVKSLLKVMCDIPGVSVVWRENMQIK